MATGETARLIAALELQDKFSATADKFDRTVGGLERQTGTLGRIGSEVGRGAQNAVRNVATIGVAAGLAIGTQVKSGIDSLRELQEVEAQTRAAIESTGGTAGITAEQIRERAEALEELSTVDDKVIQSGQNVLLTFTGVRNELGDGNDIFNQATEAALDLSIAMDQDLDQAMVQVGKALNDPIRGIGALRRVGVQLTEQQEESIRTFVEQGNVMEAQKVILGELETQFGGSSEAFGTGIGAAQRRWEDAVEGAQQALATGFLPLIEKVSERTQELLSDPEVLARIKEFGEGAAEGIDQLIDIAGKLPWDSIGDAFSLMGQGAKAALDLFTSMPSWIQTAVLTGWGLNKLTGGALGNIVGELGKGLIKGVLGMTAGVVNLNAGVVNGGPGGVAGGPAGAGGRGLLGKIGGGLALAGGLAAVGVAAVEVVNFENMRTEATAHLETILDNMPNDTAEEIDESISRIESEINKERPFLEGILFNTNVKPQLEDQIDELQDTKKAVARSEAAMRDAIPWHQRNVSEIQALNASEGTRFANLQTTTSGLGGRIDQLAKTPHNISVQNTVNVSTPTYINASMVAATARRTVYYNGYSQQGSQVAL